MARSRTVEVLLSVPLLILTGFVVLFYSILALFLALTAGGLDVAVPAHTASHVRIIAGLSWVAVVGIYTAQIICAVLRLKSTKPVIAFSAAILLLEFVVIGVALNAMGA